MQKLFVGFAFIIFLKELIKSTTNILAVFFFKPSHKNIKDYQNKSKFHENLDYSAHKP